MSLKPDLFEGCRFDFTRPLNQKFSLQHSLFMGSVEVPSQGAQTFKMPAASYEFGANLIDQKVHLYRSVAAANPPPPHSSVSHRQTDSLCCAGVPGDAHRSPADGWSPERPHQVRPTPPRFPIAGAIPAGDDGVYHSDHGEPRERADDSPSVKWAVGARLRLASRWYLKAAVDGCRLTAVCGLGACRYDLNDMYSLKMQTQVANEKSFSQVMFDLDVKGVDWQGQVSHSPVSYSYSRALRVLTRCVSSHAGKVPATGETWKQRLLRRQLPAKRHPHAGAGW